MTFVFASKGAGRSRHVSGDVAKALALFEVPNDESATTPAECNALHQRKQASLLRLEPSKLHQLLKALREHHHKNYPIKYEQTYQKKRRRRSTQRRRRLTSRSPADWTLRWATTWARSSRYCVNMNGAPRIRTPSRRSGARSCHAPGGILHAVLDTV